MKLRVMESIGLRLVYSLNENRRENCGEEKSENFEFSNLLEIKV